METTNTKLQEAVEDLCAWWLSESQEFRQLVLSILAALPGSDDLESFIEAGILPKIIMGWKELELLSNLLSTIEDQADVAYAIRKLSEEEGYYGEDKEDEESDLSQDDGGEV